MKRPKVGPGALVAAAFIGPGTVTTCTLAGVGFGTALLWALLFATAATIVLQEMAARVGVVAGMGLGEAMRQRLTSPMLRWSGVFLVVGAIGLGNAAYQTGNLLGASLGAEVLFGGSMQAWAVGIAVLAGVLLWFGRYRAIERILVGLVILMSAVFLVTAIRLGWSWTDLWRGLLIPSIPEGGTFVAIGLIGTTVVPYNLFLHASAARERFHGQGSLGEARLDLVVAIGLGGLISMAITVTAAQSGLQDVHSAADMARQLEPVLGPSARVLFALGLLAAGLTSAITAPLAAAYAVSGAAGWAPDLATARPRLVWITVLGTGALFAGSGVRPVPAILFAQVTNGLLLPFMAGLLLLVTNDPSIMGTAANRLPARVLGFGVVAVTLVLGVRGILNALGL